MNIDPNSGIFGFADQCATRAVVVGRLFRSKFGRHETLHVRTSTSSLDCLTVPVLTTEPQSIPTLCPHQRFREDIRITKPLQDQSLLCRLDSPLTYIPSL